MQKIQNTNPYKLLIIILLLSLPLSLQAQQVCESSRQQITLSDSLKLILFKEVSGNQIFFVPTTLQLSRANGKPEYSYQEYTNPDSTSPDGAIFHILLHWGLTKQQRKELLIRAKELYGDKALLGGALQLESIADLRISNKSRIGKILNTSLQSKGHPPTTSGGKIALSFHIGKNDVQFISEAFKKPTKMVETSFRLTYNYKTYHHGSRISQSNTITLRGNLKK
ncbi:MAG: hypothetical protein AAF934_11320, partial [Bacteroidota bacterium]